MGKLTFANFILLSFAVGGLTQTFNGFNPYNFMRQAPPEEPQVVEVIRWRQPVCITSGPGVLPCQVNHNYRSVQSSLKEDPQQSGKRVTKDTEASEELVKKLTQDESDLDFSSLESLEKDDSKKRSARTPRARKHLYSSRIRRVVQIENMGTSSLEEPASKVIRHSRYLRLGPAMMARSPPRRQTVYVTKVVDSPVVATLVASTCLPDIGVPICDEIGNVVATQNVAHPPAPAPAPAYHPQQPPSYVPANNQHAGYAPPPAPPASSQYSAPPEHAAYAPVSYEHQQQASYNHNSEPTHYAGYAPPAAPGVYESQPSAPYVPANSQGIASYPNYQIQYHQSQSQSTPSPDLGQTIEEFINRPNYVQTNERPGVKPVIVVQPTPQPTLLEGINAFFMQNGSWFNVFSRPGSNNQQNGGNQIVTSVVQIPSYQQLIYRPENDISDPNILTIINPNNQPGAGPPTETPGIFGGLFAAPARPEGVVQTTTTTTAQPPSILDGLNNIFRPTNRPLVIERPDRIPIVVEKPVYVVEQPVVPGLLDIFQNPNRPTDVDSSDGAEVITDPVYVLQRPPDNPPLFGLLPNNWNIFSGPSTEPNPDRPTVELTENLQQAQLVVVDEHQNSPSNGPVVVQSNPAPSVINILPVQTVQAPAQPSQTVQNQRPGTNTSATGFIESLNSSIGWQGASFGFGLGLGSITQTNPAKTGIDLKASPTDPETYVDPNGLPKPETDASHITSGEVEEPLVETGVSYDSTIPDVYDRSLLAEGTKELDKIEVSEVHEQVDNEA